MFGEKLIEKDKIYTCSKKRKEWFAAHRAQKTINCYIYNYIKLTHIWEKKKVYKLES